MLPLSLFAIPPLSVTFGTQKLSGFSTYSIGGITNSKFGKIAYHFPVSELQFPTNVYVANIRLSSPFTKRFLAHLYIQKNISNDAGKLKDSDWLSADATTQDIYSESDTQLNLYSVDLTLSTSLSCIIYPNQHQTTYRFLLGYSYQHFGFQAHDLVQWYPSDPTRQGLTQAGTVITYNLVQTMPYWTFEIDHTLGPFSIRLANSYSPYVTITDQDDHILRSKLAKGSLTGYMHLARLALHYPITPFLSSFIRLRSQTIHSYGTQVQSRYQKTSEGDVGHIADIDEKIKRKLSDISFGLTYRLQPLTLATTTHIDAITSSLIRLGSSLYIPFQERHASFGPHLEFNNNAFILGIGYYQGENIVNMLSKGIYTTIPIYVLYKLPFIPYLQLGGGYSFYSNTIDPHAISDLTRLGFSNITETVQSNWFGLLSFEITMPYSNDHVHYFARYSYQNTTMQSRGDNHHVIKPLSLSTVQTGISIAL